MPTHEETQQFLREFAALTPAQRARFLDTIHKMSTICALGSDFARAYE